MGLYYYRARYYHPRLQHFISEDPLRFTGGDVNLYTYVSNNPFSFRDPKGLILEKIFTGPLDTHSGVAITAEQFVNYVGGQSLSDVQHSADQRTPTSDSSAGGPDTQYRYVRDPADPNAIIDMRHFLVVGQQGETFGLGVEIAQALQGIRNSAFDPQDFYSNAIGTQFFKNYDPSKSLSDQLRDFFNQRRHMYGRK